MQEHSCSVQPLALIQPFSGWHQHGCLRFVQMGFCSLTPILCECEWGREGGMCGVGKCVCKCVMSYIMCACVRGDFVYVCASVYVRVCLSLSLSITHTFSPVYVTWDFIHTHRLLLIGFPIPSAGGSPPLIAPQPHTTPSIFSLADVTFLNVV